MLNVYFDNHYHPPHDCGPRLVVVLGPIREQRAAPKPTPQFRRFPLFGELIMAFSMSDSQEVVVTIQAVDKKGNPARFDGVPEWSSDNTDVLALTPAADGLSCKVAAAGPLGTGTVQVKADADLGAGVVDIFGTLAVEITAGGATSVTLIPGTPTEQP